MDKRTAAVVVTYNRKDTLLRCIDALLSQTASVNAAAAASDGGLLSKLDKILDAIERGQILTIDGEQLVGATADKFDNALGKRRALAARGAM